MEDRTVFLSLSTLRTYPDCLAAGVHGSSMEPTLHDGDVVLVDPFATTPRSGDIVVAYVGGFQGGFICGEWRRPRGKDWWLYKHNENDSSYPRVLLGRVPSLRAICGTVRAIVSRKAASDDDLAMIMCRPVGRPLRRPLREQEIGSDEIQKRQAAAIAEYRSLAAAVRDTWRRGSSCLQLVSPTPESAPCHA